MQPVFRLRYLAAVIIVTVCCAGAPELPAPGDTPQERYLAGMQKLETNDLAAAEIAFNRASELDNRSAEGHAGKAFLELARNRFGQAIRHANHALSRDPVFFDAAAVKALAIASRAEGDNWLDDALETLDDALHADPPHERCLFALGQVYFMAADYPRARDAYNRVIARDSSFRRKAEMQSARSEKLEQAGPLSDRARGIALAESVSRGDFCVLMIDRLHILEHLASHRPQLYESLFDKDRRRRKSPDVYAEVSGNRWREAILDVAVLNLPSFGLYPDGCFYHDQLVTRAEVASAIQDALVLLSGDRTLATRFIGSTSPVDDVHPDSYAYNAIRLCIEREYLSMQSDDAFKPGDTPDGIEVVLALAAAESDSAR